MRKPSNGLADIRQASARVPPTLTEGKITPEILHRWERACLHFFRHKKVKEEDQVEDILFGVKDLRLSHWIEANESPLKALPFSKFMAELREEALGIDWARTLRREILRTRQDNRVFFDWVCEIEVKNAILVAAPSARISVQRLRDHFEAHMSDALAQRCKKSTIISITDYRDWTKAVEQEDVLLRQDLEIENARYTNLLAMNTSSRPTSSGSRPLITSTSSNSANSAQTPSPHRYQSSRTRRGRFLPRPMDASSADNRMQDTVPAIAPMVSLGSINGSQRLWWKEFATRGTVLIGFVY